MNEIFTRRSVRAFTAEPVTQEQLTQLLKAAMRAPSSMNQQAWEFVVIRDKQTMLEILQFHPHAVPVKQADCIIVVCANLPKRKFPTDAYILDCAAATQNILLEAVHLDLGAVWLGMYPYPERMEGMKKLLSLPEDVVVISAVAVGHSAQTPEPIDTYQPELVHQERW